MQTHHFADASLPSFKNHLEWHKDNYDGHELIVRFNDYYGGCWGERTWVFVRRKATSDSVAEPRRLRDVRVGDHVRTPRGYRRVQRLWMFDLTNSGKDVVRWGGMWLTSHHPVLVGHQWVYPAELGVLTPFSRVQEQVYNYSIYWSHIYIYI